MSSLVRDDTGIALEGLEFSVPGGTYEDDAGYTYVVSPATFGFTRVHFASLDDSPLEEDEFVIAVARGYGDQMRSRIASRGPQINPGGYSPIYSGAATVSRLPPSRPNPANALNDFYYPDEFPPSLWEAIVSPDVLDHNFTAVIPFTIQGNEYVDPVSSNYSVKVNGQWLALDSTTWRWTIDSQYFLVVDPPGYPYTQDVTIDRDAMTGFGFALTDFSLTEQ